MFSEFFWQAVTIEEGPRQDNMAFEKIYFVGLRGRSPPPFIMRNVFSSTQWSLLPLNGSLDYQPFFEIKKLYLGPLMKKQNRFCEIRVSAKSLTMGTWQWPTGSKFWRLLVDLKGTIRRNKVLNGCEYSTVNKVQYMPNINDFAIWNLWNFFF